MKVGVTGATGQLGRIVVEKLKKRISSDSIIALVRTPQKASDLGVEAREFDYEKPENMVASLKGVEKLLLISSSEVGKRIQQHANVIEAAKKAGVKLIAYTSLLRADSSSLVLAPEHLETEKLLKSSGIPYVILRHGWYTENYTGSINAIVESGVLAGCSGDGKISSASRADFAEADVAVVTTPGHEGKTYELAGDEAYTMADLATVISEKSGVMVKYHNLSVDEYGKFLESVGMPAGVAQFFASTHVSTEKGDLYSDSKQLSGLIGRSTSSLSDVVGDALKDVK